MPLSLVFLMEGADQPKSFFESSTSIEQDPIVFICPSPSISLRHQKWIIQDTIHLSGITDFIVFKSLFQDHENMF